MQNHKFSVKADQAAVKQSGEFLIGNDLRVTRLGYGAMRITGDGVWGEPTDRAEAIRVLRRAVEFGINFIDTADSYGPGVSEEIIAEALHPTLNTQLCGIPHHLPASSVESGGNDA